MSKAVMAHNFGLTPSVELPRSQFRMPFRHMTDIDAGWLVPVMHMHTLPGDTISIDPTIFSRMTTPLYPLMDSLYMDLHVFWTPNRLLWENHNKFHGEKVNPGDSTVYTIPVLTGGNSSNPNGDLTTVAGRKQRLLNYMGIPDTVVNNQTDISALPFRCYSLIYDEWYRHQDLIDSIGINTGDGPDNQNTTYEYKLERRAKRFDYFTQALPNPQKGSESVTLPLGTSAPIVYGPNISGTDNTDNAVVQGRVGTTAHFGYDTDVPADNYTVMPADTYHGLKADLTTATASSINNIRLAFQTQRLLEKDARSGTRYAEICAGHFGISNFHDVVYRPVYLGGERTKINVNAVAATAQLTRDLGELAGIGTGLLQGGGITQSFQEHGILMCIVSIFQDQTYQAGLNRHWCKQTRFDTYYPSLAHLGEQAVLEKEIYCDSASTATQDDVFGYVPRYDEYRHLPSLVTGIFQSSATGSLDAWHLSQDYAGTPPALNQEWIEENPPIDRVQATSENHFIVDTFLDIKAARVLPTHGVPGMLDHF